MGGAAAVCVAALCAWTVCDFVGPDADRPDDALRADGVAGRGDRLAIVSRRGDKLAVARPNSPWTYYALLFDPHPSSPASASFTDDDSFQSNIRPAVLTLSVPMPMPGPTGDMDPLALLLASKKKAGRGAGMS